MSREFRLPDLGEGVTEGQIVRVLVADGDRVAEDQPILEVETDKASVEIPSPHSGLVEKVHVVPEQVVNVGDVMVTFSGDGATATAAAAPGRTQEAAGRTKPASPAVRKLARSLGVSLAAIEGTGPGGRVTRQDVERSAGGAPPPAPVTAPTGEAGSDSWGPTRREPITRARRAIAEAMARSASSIPHATDTDDADVTDLDRLRRGRVPDHGDRKLTLLPFVVRATVLALQKHPIFNASYDEAAGVIVYHDYIGIAIGVHTERGLIAPVLRGVDRLSVPQIAELLADLADKARTASFEVNDTRGGTFTISNAGAVGGSRYSTPIINPPQAAVLALGRTRRRPWVLDEDPARVVGRLIMPLSLSFDHRIIDGAQEVRFMQEIIGLLERPAPLVI